VKLIGSEPRGQTGLVASGFEPDPAGTIDHLLMSLVSMV
jgi:hypothetical protein